MLRIFIGLFGLLFLSGVALSHEWYPKNCCDDNDCSPVIEFKKISKWGERPKFYVRNKTGWGIWYPPEVPPNVDRNGKAVYPPDNKMHVCILVDYPCMVEEDEACYEKFEKSKRNGVPKGNVKCVFIPAKT